MGWTESAGREDAANLDGAAADACLKGPVRVPPPHPVKPHLRPPLRPPPRTPLPTARAPRAARRFERARGVQERATAERDLLGCCYKRAGWGGGRWGGSVVEVLVGWAGEGEGVGGSRREAAVAGCMNRPSPPNALGGSDTRPLIDPIGPADRPRAASGARPS